MHLLVHLTLRLQAANFLDIKSLLDLTCKHVASMIKNKGPQEIRDQFNIRNDFTPEEEERVRVNPVHRHRYLVGQTAWCAHMLFVASLSGSKGE